MNAMRKILLDRDLAAYAQIARLSPDLAEIGMHICITAAETLPEQHRLWSHRWLTERGLETMLPDHLLPIPPTIVSAVGISVNFHADWDLGKDVEQRMADKVAEMYADGDIDPALVSREITDLRVNLIGI
jgi:hypothetical protein